MKEEKLSTAPFSLTKKSGTKRELSPYYPYKRKARGKENNPGSLGTGLFACGARAGNPEGQPQEKEISATVKYAEPVPVAQSASGDIKIMEMDAVSASGQWDIRGLNVGLSNEDEPNGIVSVSAEIEGKTVDWANFATHFEDASATFKPSGTTDLPPGEYVADLTFLRVGGSEGSEEIVAHDVTITVP